MPLVTVLYSCLAVTEPVCSVWLARHTGFVFPLVAD